MPTSDKPLYGSVPNGEPARLLGEDEAETLSADEEDDEAVVDDEGEGKPIRYSEPDEENEGVPEEESDEATGEFPAYVPEDDPGSEYEEGSDEGSEETGSESEATEEEGESGEPEVVGDE